MKLTGKMICPIIAVVLLAVLAALYAFPVPVHIDRTYSAVWLEPESGTQTANGYVRIDGTKWVYLFQKHRPDELKNAWGNTFLSCWTASDKTPLKYYISERERKIDFYITGNPPAVRADLDEPYSSNRSVLWRDYRLECGIVVPQGKDAESYVICFPAGTVNDAKQIYEDFSPCVPQK
jgi:hypothetical protein